MRKISRTRSRSSSRCTSARPEAPCWIEEGRHRRPSFCPTSLRSVSEEPRLRPARALIGRLPPLEAGRFLAGLRPSEAERPEYQERARHARTVAAARRPDFDVRGVVTEAPQAVHEHWVAITETPIGRRLSERGRRPAPVDLRRVVAVQPHVFTDTDLPGARPRDPTAIAAVTLAPPGPMEVETQFDPRRNLWVIDPPSPGLPNRTRAPCGRGGGRPRLRPRVPLRRVVPEGLSLR